MLLLRVLRQFYDYILALNFMINLQSKLVRKLNPISVFSEWWISPMGGQARRVKKVIELVDNTDLSGELACAGGACEIQ